MYERDTVETRLSTVVVVVGGPPELVEATRMVAGMLPRVSVETCPIKQAATSIAGSFPFAIVLSDDVYLFDPTEFEALARDVNGRIIRVPGDESEVRQFVLRLRDPLMAALRARLDR